VFDDEGCPTVCAPRATLGQSCASAPCVAELACNYEVYECEPRGGLGEDCAYVACEADLVCVATEVSYVCLDDYPPAPVAGDPCDSDDAWSCDVFDEGLVCLEGLSGGECVAIELGELGDGCNAESTWDVAHVGWCDGIASTTYCAALPAGGGVCVLRPTIGDACDPAAAPCRASDSTCLDDDGDGAYQCEPFAAFGESCVDRPCSTDLTCDYDDTYTCVPIVDSVDTCE
jgi:hypothetical protein